MVKKILHKIKRDPELLEGEDEIFFARAHYMHLLNKLFPTMITLLVSFILLLFLSSGGSLSFQLILLISCAFAWLLFHLFANKSKSLYYTSIVAGIGISALFSFHFLFSWGDISGISFARSQMRLYVNTGFIVFAMLFLSGIAYSLVEFKEFKEKNLLWVISLGPLSLPFIYLLLRWLLVEPGPSQPFNVFLLSYFNSSLEIIAVLLSLICLFLMTITYIDWVDEGIRLTNMRLISTSDDFAGITGERQDFVSISDIQNVQSNTKNYLRHWLNYGTITVTTTVSDKSIVFERIKAPRELQKKIMDQVKALQTRHSDANFKRMIEEKVLKIPGTKTKPKPDLPSSVTPSCLRKIGLLKENPLYNEKDQSITWHKHYIFLFARVLRPFIFLALGLGLMFTLMIGNFSSLILWGLSILLLLIFCAWEAWEIEDHRNDLYILKPNEVIDIEKLPFGPEDQQTASLGNIVNISFQTTFLGKFFGYGNVLLETAGAKGKFTFDRVPKPKEVVKVIKTHQIEFRKSEKERNLGDALNLLRAYDERREARDERTREEILAAIYELRSDYNSYILGNHG